MWRLVKSELGYNWYTYALISIMMVLYTIFSIVDFKLFSGKNSNADVWCGLYSFLFIIVILKVWGQRFKEKRNRYLSVLPISNKQIAVSRFLFATLPFIVVVFYLILIHLIIMNKWHRESSSMLVQIGVMFVLFAGFIRARDDWFSHWNFGKRVQSTFVSVLIIQILIVVLFVSLPNFYAHLTPIFGEMYYHYVKTMFFILGLIIMITTIFSFIKRKSYLN